jgi:hypothetical protein
MPFSSKMIDLARRQAATAAYNGFDPVWEVPSPEVAATAGRFLNYAGVSTILVRVVP